MNRWATSIRDSMNPPLAALRGLTRRDIVAYLVTIVIGIIGAWAAYKLNMPLAWFLGPMIATAIFAIFGVEMRAPNFMRPIAVPILGFMLGATFLPEIIGQIGEWLFSVLMIPVFLLVGGLASYAYLRTAARYDAITAFFSSVPGGLTAMILLGEFYKGDVVKIATAQSMRILVVVVIIALIFSTALGVSRDDAQGPDVGWVDLTSSDVSWFFICVVVGSIFGRLVHMPTPTILGPLFFSAVLHLTGVTAANVPNELSIFAQFVVGACIGARFSGLTLRTVSKSLVHGSVSAVLMLVVSGVVSMIVFLVSGIDPFEAWLAFSPGGMTEMGLMALAIGQSVAYVTIAHVIRLVIVMFAAPVMVKLLTERPAE